jgi:hypothetical protein
MIQQKVNGGFSDRSFARDSRDLVSGNEDLIAAMQENEMWWTLHWQEIRRGGHYKFKPIYSEEK